MKVMATLAWWRAAQTPLVRLLLLVVLIPVACRAQHADQTVEAGSSAPASTRSTPAEAAAQQQANQPSGVGFAKANAGAIEFELNGLRYQTLTRNGLTIMFAQTPAVVRTYNIMQVTVINGSQRSIDIKPADFLFIDAAMVQRIQPIAPRDVINEFMSKANREDVVKLVSAYEQTLYGMTRVSPTSGYEQRRRSMLAEFASAKFRAAATASAIVFVQTKLVPGESTDGALFFPTMGKVLGAGKLFVTVTDQLFEFDTYANPGNPNELANPRKR